MHKRHDITLLKRSISYTFVFAETQKVASNSKVLHWNFSFPHSMSYSVNSQATVRAALCFICEPRHDKTNKMTVRPPKA